MAGNTTAEMEALAKDAAQGAVRNASESSPQFGSAADQRNLEDHIARSRARADAAKAGINTAAAESAAAAPPAPASTSPKPAAAPHASSPAPAALNTGTTANTGGTTQTATHAAEEATTTKSLTKSVSNGAKSWLRKSADFASEFVSGRIIGLVKKAGIVGVGYEGVTTITKGREQLEQGDSRGAMETAGRGVGVIGGIAATAGAGAALGAPAGPLVMAAGLIAGAAAGVLTSETFGNIGGKAMAALLPEEKDIVPESDRLHQNFMNALKIKVRAGNSAKPEQNDAVTKARAELDTFFKDNTSFSSQERAEHMRRIEENFTKLAVRDAELLANAPKVLEETKAKFKLASMAYLEDGSKESQDKFQASAKAYILAQRQALRAQGKTQTIEETRAFTETEFNGYAAQVEAARAAARANAPSAGATPSTGATPSAGATPARTPSFSEAMTPPAPPPAPPKEKTFFDTLKDIPVIGPVIAGVGSYFGAGETDPNKKSQFGKLIDTATGWLGDTKKGLSGMGALAAGIAVVAAVSSMLDGGILGMVAGLFAAAIIVPIISNVMKSFGAASTPEAARTPSLDGPQHKKTIEVSQQQQVSTGGPSVQEAARQANLQPTPSLTGGTSVQGQGTQITPTPAAVATVAENGPAGRSATP